MFNVIDVLNVTVSMLLISKMLSEDPLPIVICKCMTYSWKNLGVNINKSLLQYFSFSLRTGKFLQLLKTIGVARRQVRYMAGGEPYY